MPLKSSRFSSRIDPNWSTLTFSLLFFAETLFVSTARKSKACQIEFCTDSNIFPNWQSLFHTSSSTPIYCHFFSNIKDSTEFWVPQPRKVFDVKLQTSKMRGSVKLYSLRTLKNPVGKRAWEAGCGDVHGAEVRARLDSLRIGAHQNSAQTNSEQESLNANFKLKKYLHSVLLIWSS